MKSIANIISSCRIVLSLLLIFAEPLSTVFYVLYLVCGISDMIDGAVARRLGAASTLGEKLDSVADLILTAVLLIKLFPIINPSVGILTWAVMIGLIRLASMLVVYIRFKTFAILHTYGNKITGMLLFIFPLLLPFTNTILLMSVICSIATLSAMEELMLQLRSKQQQANKQSIFIK